MRAAIFAHLDAGGADLDPNAREALERLAAVKSKEGAPAAH